MRWRRPKTGDRRTQTGFLWFLQQALLKDGDCQIRWLEKATWEEEFYGDQWIPKHWIDDEENK